MAQKKFFVQTVFKATRSTLPFCKFAWVRMLKGAVHKAFDFGHAQGFFKGCSVMSEFMHAGNT